MAIVHDYQAKFQAPAIDAKFEGALHELACAKIRRRGSTADRGARCSGEQPLVRRIARSGRASRSPAPRRLRSDLALRSVASPVARLGRGRAPQSRQCGRGAARTWRRAVVPGRRFRRGRRASAAGSRRRSSKNRTSTPRPSTGRSGSATRTGMWWWSPVRTAKAAPELCLLAGSGRAAKRRQVMRCRTRSPLTSQW